MSGDVARCPHAQLARAFEPTDHYRELRDQVPLLHEPDHDPPFYALTRFDDIVTLLKQPSQWLNGDGPGVFYQEVGVLGTTDEPDHSRHRHVLRDAFLPTVIQRLAPGVAAIVDQLLDRVVPLGEGDFVELFAAPFPALVIAELLGVPESDRSDFQHWSDLAVAALTGGDIDRYHEAKAAIERHIATGMDARDAMGVDERPDDVLTRLAGARAEGVLSHAEALHIGYQLLVAGHETTTSLLGMMLYRLIERPAAMAQLRDDPSLIPTAIEEAVRFDSPVHGLFRTNLEATELHGVPLPPRTKVQLVYASANRDPSRFSDPEEFVVGRDPKELGRHLAFGWGIHHCIGAPLARMESKVAFERILARMDDIALAGEPKRNDSFVLHGLTSLPITWRPRQPAIDPASGASS